VGWIVKNTRKAVKSLHTLDTNAETLAGIAKEFKPNSGSSLRDRIDAIEARQVQTDKLLVGVIARIAVDHPDAVEEETPTTA
jgi:hypothetical protein